MGDDMKEFICLFITILIIISMSALCFTIVYDTSVKYVKNEPKPQKRKKHSKEDDIITLEQCKDLYYPEFRFIVVRQSTNVPLYAFATFEHAKNEIKRLMMTCCDSYYIVNLDEQ